MAFAAASIQLYSRLWWELERLQAPALDRGGGTGSAFEMQLLTFRLEVVLLLDACDSRAWQAFLRPDERLTLETILRTVLDLIAVPLPALGRAVIHRAQDWLLDAVIDQFERSHEAPRSAERERLAS
jgi:hypothetical protein